jgi:hypothetical protein
MPKATIVIQNTGESFTFDNIRSEQYDEPVDVTQKKVQEGSDVSNHAETRPKAATIEYVVTESPDPDAPGPPPGQRVREARKFLRKCKEEFIVAETTKFGALADYLIENFPHGVDSDKVTVFPVNLTEFRIGQTETVEFPDNLAVEKHRGRVGSQVDNGRKAVEKETKVEKSGPEAGSEAQNRVAEQTKRLLENISPEAQQ